MKVCLYGAGAVGGFIGANLGRAGCELSAVEMGRTLEALRTHGIRVQAKDEIWQQPICATDNPAELGVQDLIVVAVKGPTLVQVAKHIAPLLGPETVILQAMNGVPWWFFHGYGGQYAGMRLESVDPGGTIAAAIPTRHIVGCVIHAGFSSIEPGFARLDTPNRKRLVIGEPDGSDSERLRKLEALLLKATFEVKVSQQIQSDIWYKLLGNMSRNPVSAITGATLDLIVEDPLVNGFCLRVMEEAKRIGNKFGLEIKDSGEDRSAAARGMGAFKTSMLQDVEAGKPVELDSFLGVVREIGEEVGEATTNIDILLGLARLHAQVHGLYPRPRRAVMAGA